MKKFNHYGIKPQNDEDAYAAIIGLYGLIICAAIVYFPIVYFFGPFGS